MTNEGLALIITETLQRWHGHVLAPPTKRAHRQSTFEAIRKDLIDAVQAANDPDAWLKAMREGK